MNWNNILFSSLLQILIIIYLRKLRIDLFPYQVQLNSGNLYVLGPSTIISIRSSVSILYYLAKLVTDASIWIQYRHNIDISTLLQRLKNTRMIHVIHMHVIICQLTPYMVNAYKTRTHPLLALERDDISLYLYHFDPKSLYKLIFL